MSQLNYLTNYVSDFEAALLHDNTQHTYDEYIDVDTFVDTLLINELSKNYDAYRLSSYFYKKREGKLESGPLWDQELDFGNLVKETYVSSISHLLLVIDHI